MLHKFGCPTCGNIVSVGNADGSEPTSYECSNCHVDCVIVEGKTDTRAFKDYRKHIDTRIRDIKYDLFMKLWNKDV